MPERAGAIDLEAVARESEREYKGILDRAVDALPRELAATKCWRMDALESASSTNQTGNHDLVVMGSRGRGEIHSPLLGSVSHEVLNASPSAVLIAHASDDESRSS